MNTLLKIALIASVALVNIAAQALMRHTFKVAAQTGGTLTPAGEVARFLTMPTAWVAIFVQGIGFLLWLGIISRMELTYALPLGSAIVTLVLFLLGYFYLHEQVTAMRIAGAVLILVGTFLIGKKG